MSASLSTELRESILTAASRAPSAHNAQPWRMSPQGPDSYLLWYAYSDKLLADPDDRDGIMALGGFYETLRLAAAYNGVVAEFEPHVVNHPMGITLGVVTLKEGEPPSDELAEFITKRQANRSAYSRIPLPPLMAEQLQAYGNILLPPSQIAPLVAKASVLAWKDSCFVEDLGKWTRFTDDSPDGMTTDCLDLSKIDQAALKFALKRGKLPGFLARLYASRDVRLTKASSALCVLTTPSRSPIALFETGQRLIRSWTFINSLGWSWHPMSIVIDQATVSQLAGLLGGKDGVAIYRVGHTRELVPWSKRRPFASFVVPAPH